MDMAIGVTLQPTALEDLKGTRLCKVRIKVCKEGPSAHPRVPCVSKRMEGIPFTEDGTKDKEDTGWYRERAISYRIHSPEHNYSTTEKEALGQKEGLTEFQAIMKREKTTSATDHVALQWARTYENANQRLASWGARYALYHELGIVHRAGEVHSEVEALSRQSPMHQSPIGNSSHRLKGVLQQNPLMIWEEITE